jgi:hypothetical protein
MRGQDETSPKDIFRGTDTTVTARVNGDEYLNSGLVNREERSGWLEQRMGLTHVLATDTFTRKHQNCPFSLLYEREAPSAFAIQSGTRKDGSLEAADYPAMHVLAKHNFTKKHQDGLLDQDISPVQKHALREQNQCTPSTKRTMASEPRFPWRKLCIHSFIRSLKRFTHKPRRFLLLRQHRGKM